MGFNPDPSKQVQEVIFCRKIQNTCHTSIYFNNKTVEQVLSQKNLGRILDNKLNVQTILKKVNKTIGLLLKLQNILPLGPLLTNYKSFVRYHLDNGDILYDQDYDNSFLQKLEAM